MIVLEHGWNLSDNTAALHGEGRGRPRRQVGREIPVIWVDGTSFNDEMGVHDHYSRRDLYAWLGY
jgi:hypothetical protein